MGANLSPAARKAFEQSHAILKMDANPARFKWAQQISESWRGCCRRRREWLAISGCDTYLCGRNWDSLSRASRERLSAVNHG